MRNFLPMLRFIPAKVLNRWPDRAVRINGLAILILLLGSALSLTYAQQTETISGQVTFAETGQPVPGANVTIRGTQTGTITDINGNYSIVAGEGDVLVISFIGYTTREVPVGTATTYDVAISEDVTQLDEVVKVGYGTMKRSDLTGAVVSVSSEDIQKSSPTSFDQALQGRAAGVLVTQNSGQPGGGVSVQIRGVNTLSGNSEPLYVIDGVPLSGQSGNSTNALATINPSDIESMEVLKDASATAIYGSRAANGVILITTRRGRGGETLVTYDGSYGLQHLPKYIDVLDLQEYATFLNERQEIVGFGSKPEFADPSVLGEGTNWQKEMFQLAPQTNHNLTISGGDDKTQFAVSGSYLDQDGIAIGSYFNRFSLRINIDNQTRDWLKLSASLSASRTNERITISEYNLLSEAIKQSPDIPVRNPDGSWAGPEDEFGVSNPVARALDTEDLQKRTQLLSNVYAEIYFLKYLTFRTEFGTNISYTNRYKFEPSYEYGQVKNPVTESSRTASNNLDWILKNYLTYNQVVAEKHSLQMMLGQEAQSGVWESVEARRQGFLTNTIHEVNAGDISTSIAYSQKSDWALASYFGRLNYSYDDRYLLTATFRADGSSKFGPDNKWGFFPSYALAWKISNEQFMANSSQISNLKLRLGYGEVGGQNIPSYAYGSMMGNWATYYGSGFLLGNLPNPDVQWESQNSYNIGLDLAMFRNRIEFVVDAYLKQTDNLLLVLPMPLYTATDLDWSVAYIQPPAVNIGSLENKGIEFMLNTVNTEGEFRWQSSFTMSFNRNKITKLVTSGSFIDESIGTQTISRTAVGQPVGQFYGYLTDGIYANADELFAGTHTAGVEVGTQPDVSVWVGDIRFQNLDGNDSINEMDRTYMGDPNPVFSFGFNNTFEYRNFDLTIYMNGTYGNKIFNEIKHLTEDPMSRSGMLGSVRDYARIEFYDAEGDPNDPYNQYVTNPETSVPRIVTSDPNENMRISDRYIEDGSYLRIKSFVLGYTLPAGVTNTLSIDRVRFYLNIQNLYTFTKYSGYDPEIGAAGQNVLKSGVDEGRYPSPRVYLLGVNVNF